MSLVAAVEVPAAVWRKQRRGELGPEDAATLVAEFGADLWGTGDEPPRYAVVAVTEAVVEDAARLVARHPLRAYDGLQLASALAAHAAAPELERFACFDDELRAAAATEGLALLP